MTIPSELPQSRYDSRIRDKKDQDTLKNILIEEPLCECFLFSKPDDLQDRDDMNGNDVTVYSEVFGRVGSQEYDTTAPSELFSVDSSAAPEYGTVDLKRESNPSNRKEDQAETNSGRIFLDKLRSRSVTKSSSDGGHDRTSMGAPVGTIRQVAKRVSLYTLDDGPEIRDSPERKAMLNLSMSESTSYDRGEEYSRSTRSNDDGDRVHVKKDSSTMTGDKDGDDERKNTSGFFLAFIGARTESSKRGEEKTMNCDTGEKNVLRDSKGMTSPEAEKVLPTTPAAIPQHLPIPSATKELLDQPTKASAPVVASSSATIPGSLSQSPNRRWAWKDTRYSRRQNLPNVVRYENGKGRESQVLTKPAGMHVPSAILKSKEDIDNNSGLPVECDIIEDLRLVEDTQPRRVNLQAFTSKDTAQRQGRWKLPLVSRTKRDTSSTRQNGLKDLVGRFKAKRKATTESEKNQEDSAATTSCGFSFCFCSD